MNELTKEWVDKAEDDCNSANLLLLTRFERTHVLTDLLALCMSVNKDFKKIADDLSNLEGYAVAIRYPGANVSVELAEEAFKAVNRVRKFVRTRLGIK